MNLQKSLPLPEPLTQLLVPPLLPPATSGQTSARRAALSRVLSVFNVEWIRDFLLGAEGGVKEAYILASPLHQLHSVTYASDEVHSAIDLRDRNAELFASATNVMVPAFSCNGYSAGYLIEDVSGNWDPTEKFLAPGCHVHRFVMEEKTGFLVGFSNPSANSVVLASMDQIGSRLHAIHCFVFNSAQFRNLIGNTTSIHAYENSLEMSMNLSHMRNCPYCGAGGKVDCGCRIKYSLPKNSLDFRAFVENLSPRLGSYKGLGVQELFLNGSAIKTQKLDTDWSGVRMANEGSCARLLSWAIRDRLQAEPGHVPKFLLAPTKNEEAPYDSGAEKTDSGSIPDLDTAGATHTSCDLTAIDLSMESFDIGGFPLPVSKPIPKNEGPANIIFDELIKPWEPSTSLSKDVTHDNLLLISCPDPVFPSSIPGEAEGPVISDMSTSDGPNVNAPSSKAVPIAPLRIGNSGGDSSGNSDEEKRKNAAELKQMRAYQRKIRNRESAARSNLARKKRKEMQRHERAKQQNTAQDGIESAVS